MLSFELSLFSTVKTGRVLRSRLTFYLLPAVLTVRNHGVKYNKKGQLTGEVSCEVGEETCHSARGTRLIISPRPRHGTVQLATCGQRADRAEEAVADLLPVVGFRNLADVGLVALHVLLDRATVALEDVLVRSTVQVVAHGDVLHGCLQERDGGLVATYAVGVNLLAVGSLVLQEAHELVAEWAHGYVTVHTGNGGALFDGAERSTEAQEPRVLREVFHVHQSNPLNEACRVASVLHLSQRFPSSSTSHPWERMASSMSMPGEPVRVSTFWQPSQTMVGGYFIKPIVTSYA